ncbi:MAG: ABC transporter permease [Provencibacterium sp.]|jgi:peptide/nickel transport system permease protein|nr:ABC transporter permease [Provencibacterium sp.]
MLEATQTATIDHKALKADSRKKRVKQFIRALFSRKIVLVSAVGILFFILVALLAPVIAPYDPNEAFFADSLAQPSAKYLLGTDMHGRDVLSRIIYGSRVSLVVGLFAVLIACVIGTFLGLVSGYAGGLVDDVITRISEAIRAIPQVVLAMALTAVFGGGIVNLSIILGISNVVAYVRMMRGQVLTIKESDYVMAAKLQGNSSLRLMLTHILPNSVSPIIVLMTQQVGATILAEAGLSFLGLGISAPTASWGSIVNEGRTYLLQNPVYALVPGICVAVLVIFLNTFGDGVRDALDPRLRGDI